MTGRREAPFVAVLALLVTVSAVTAGAADAAAAADGKQVFLDQKCNMCHAVSSAGVAPTSKIKAPDLSGAVKDAAFAKKYVKKAADKNGKKHLKAFTGTDAQLDALVAWLQKQEKK